MVLLVSETSPLLTLIPPPPAPKPVVLFSLTKLLINEIFPASMFIPPPVAPEPVVLFPLTELLINERLPLPACTPPPSVVALPPVTVRPESVRFADETLNTRELSSSKSPAGPSELAVTSVMKVSVRRMSSPSASPVIVTFDAVDASIANVSVISSSP